MDIKGLFDQMASAIQKVSDAQEALVAKQADAEAKWKEIQAGVEAASHDLQAAKAEYESIRVQVKDISQSLGLG